jgi:hypothetical protein
MDRPRMPVLLTREEEFDIWLCGSAEEAFALAREYPPERDADRAGGIRQRGFGHRGVEENRAQVQGCSDVPLCLVARNHR